VSETRSFVLYRQLRSKSAAELYSHPKELGFGDPLGSEQIKIEFLMFESAALPHFQTLSFGFY
jgi:hypothetical protein